MRKVHPSEHQIQSAVIEWWDWYCKAYGLEPRALFAIPNGTHKSIAARMAFKREGLRAGVPDLFLAAPTKTWPSKAGLFIEMKASGRTTTEEQKSMLKMLQKNGYHTAVAHSAEAAIAIIKDYLS